ncbi:hypothetical protein KAU13_09095 [candidate division WOR-3 bacterium]|nr:hypothetical protein [candidate division WOR-3 bacterium]TET79962.1 MAG: hypothetical protein E3J41_00460 [Candidatus Cloacimonadota bacterium]
MARWILNNISIKIGSVVIAILLWFHVISERWVFETVNTPIKFQNLPEHLVIVDGADIIVTVQIRTKVKQQILLTFFGHPYIKVDLTNAVQGKNRIELSQNWIVLPSWRPLDIMGIVTPKKLIVETEEKDMKMVSVKAVISGKPQEGSFIRDIIVEPDSIVLIGGRNRLKGVKEVVTDTIDVSKKEKDFTVDKKLVIPDGSFSSEMDKVMVNILFEKYTIKTLSGVRIILKGDGDYEVYPESISVTVRGLENLLKNVNPSDIKAYIDIENAGKDVIPYFNLPEGIIFKSCEPQRVEIRLRE